MDVDPFTLPPDPGEAGKQTLQGIDFDRDGVRDDVQRWIGYTTQPTAVRSILADLARAFLVYSATPLSNSDTIEAFSAVMRRWNCLRFSVGGDVMADSLVDQLTSVIQNTSVRVTTGESADSRLAGTALPRLLVNGSVAACAS